MSKTPLTDALLNTTYIGDGTHFVDFARKLETDRAELVEALMNFMSQFAQALDAHEIPYGEEQDKADKQARALLARLEAE